VNLSSPIRSVIPTLQGDVLAVLARTSQPLTGRGVAGLVGDRASVAGVNVALRSLVDSGLVLGEEHPPSILYRLNRRHLATHSIEELADLRGQLLAAVREHLLSWSVAPWGAWLFGSMARGEGAAGSDIDILLVRPDHVVADDSRWLSQIDVFVDDVKAWTGNPCRVLEYSATEFHDLLTGPERLATDLRTDGLALTSRRLPRRTAMSRAAR
jgi:predicted nucleotidyltransferase